MLVVERTSNREAAGYREAALIRYVNSDPYVSAKSINVSRRDKVGEGLHPKQRANLPHCVYICMRVLR